MEAARLARGPPYGRFSERGGQRNIEAAAGLGGQLEAPPVGGGAGVVAAGVAVEPVAFVGQVLHARIQP